MQQGLIHIYCGDGKGKTTAALGLALRAYGRGKQVMLVQFLKSADTGELVSLALLPGFSVIRGKASQVFFARMTTEEKQATTELRNNNLGVAIGAATTRQCDLLILDEVIGAVNRGLVDYEALLKFMQNKPESLELVLTGRNPDERLLALADYISEVKKVRHPYDRGIAGREGIEK